VRFGADLSEAIGEPVKATTCSSDRQRPPELLQSVLTGRQGIDDPVDASSKQREWCCQPAPSSAADTMVDVLFLGYHCSAIVRPFFDQRRGKAHVEGSLGIPEVRCWSTTGHDVVSGEVVF
jgi:hypothetical protein